jgi:hypothetical protein
MQITLYNRDGTETNSNKVNDFIQRINNLISSIDLDIDTSDIYNLKLLIENQKCYNSKDVWYIEDMEDKINKYKSDLPF